MLATPRDNMTQMYLGLAVRSKREVEPEEMGRVRTRYQRICDQETACSQRLQHFEAAATLGAPNPNSEAWSEVMAQHEELLDTYVNFFKDFSKPDDTRLHGKILHEYSLPSRMWANGFANLDNALEPHQSQEDTLRADFAELAYKKYLELEGHVKIYVSIWHECLGDVARSRRNLEEPGSTRWCYWGSQSKMWYRRTATRFPGVGRLCRQLAMLDYPPLVKLSLLCRSLTAVLPYSAYPRAFCAELGAILSSGGEYAVPGASASHATAAFIKSCGGLYEGFLEDCQHQYLHFAELFKELLEQQPKGFEERSAHMVFILYYTMQIANSAKVRSATIAATHGPACIEPHERPRRDYILDFQGGVGYMWFCSMMHTITSRRVNALHVLPAVHLSLIVASSFLRRPSVFDVSGIPWASLAGYLNHISTGAGGDRPPFRWQSMRTSMPRPRVPLPEDFMLRGQGLCDDFWPKNYDKGWDENDPASDFGCETPQIESCRVARVLWHGFRIVDVFAPKRRNRGVSLRFDVPSMQFYALAPSSIVQDARENASAPADNAPAPSNSILAPCDDISTSSDDDDSDSSDGDSASNDDDSDSGDDDSVYSDYEPASNGNTSASNENTLAPSNNAPATGENTRTNEENLSAHLMSASIAQEDATAHGQHAQ